MSEDILVTGGGGLLGFALKKFIPRARFISSSDCDLTDYCQTRRFFENLKPRKVLHLAAKVGGVKTNARHNADLFGLNAQINVNVLKAAQESGVQRLVSFLSSCAFAFYSDRPSVEEDLHLGLPFEGNLGYSYAKRMLDIQTKLLSQQYGCRFSTLVPVTMYGPNDNWDIEEGHVIASLIHKCWLAREKGGSLEIWGGGKAVRQFIFSEDVASLAVRALELDWGPQTMILAADQGISIRELAGKVAAAMDFKGDLVFDSSKPEGQARKVLKSGVFGRTFCDFAFTSLEEGLKRTAEWFIQNKIPMATATL